MSPPTRRRARPRCERGTGAAISRRQTNDPGQRSRPTELPVGREYAAWIRALEDLAAAGTPGIPPAHIRDALASTERYRHLVHHLVQEGPP